MAESNMQEVSKEQGATAQKESKEQDSKENGNTGAQESEITELNLQNLLAKTFVIDDLKGEKLSGNDVRTLINQGKLLRQKQSDFDKATSEFTKKEQEWQKKVDEANNRIAQAEINARLARLEGVDPEEYDPYAEQNPTKPVESRGQIVEDREAFRTNLLNDVQKLLVDDRQERERNVAVNQFNADRLRIAKQQGKVEYGLTEDESEQMFSHMEVSLSAIEKAKQSINTGDQDSAMKSLREADEYQRRADKIRVDGLLRRQMSQAKEAEKKQVEIASKEIEESVSLKEYKPVMNPEKDMGQTEREMLARARKNEQIMKSNRNI